MLRHIVMWKMNGETPERREEQAEVVIAALAPLAGRVPSLRALELHRDELKDGANWEVTLIAEFDDVEGLQAYAVHPDHLAAVDVVKANAASRAGIDFTV